MKKVTENVEKFAKTLPILPLAWGTSIVAAQKFASKNREKLLQGAGMSAKGEFGKYENGVFEKYEDSFREQITGNIYWKDNDWTELGQLTSKKEDYPNFFSRSAQLSKERKWWLSVTNPTWINLLLKTLDTDIHAQAAWFTWRLTDTKDETLQAYFNTPNSMNDAGTNAGRLYQLLWWWTNVISAGTKNKPGNYDALKKMTFWAESGTTET